MLHKLSADEGYLPRSTWRRKLPPNSCKSRRSPIWRAHEQTSAFSRAKKPAHTCLTKASEGIGVSATRNSPSIDTETLMAASYGMITGADDTVTTVILGRHISITFRTVRLAARTRSRRRARSGSRAVHWDRSPACAAAARPGHRCCDRKYPHEFG
jgi:hypothetical protein